MMPAGASSEPSMSAPNAHPSHPSTGGSGPLVKMLGFVIEGVGILVTGLGLNYFLQLINGNGSSNVNTIYNNLFHTLEAGVILAGIGVIVIGIGLYLEARHR
jgi:hypothetical protein